MAAPVGHNENHEPELPGLRAARGSSRSPEPHSVASPVGGVSVGDESVQQQCGEPKKESWFSKWDWRGEFWWWILLRMLSCGVSLASKEKHGESIGIEVGNLWSS